MGKLDDIRALGPPGIMRQFGRADAGFEKRNLDVVKKQVQTMVKEAKAKIEPSAKGSARKGALIGLRVPPDILKRLDATLDGGTRQATILALLDEHLGR